MQLASNFVGTLKAASVCSVLVSTGVRKGYLVMAPGDGSDRVVISAYYLSDIVDALKTLEGIICPSLCERKSVHSAQDPD